MSLPLAGLRVIDLTRALAGPYCAMMLGDLGADVIKVEQPGKGDESRGWGPPFQAGESSYFLSINRNKRSIELDLKSAEGKEALRRLIASADVLLENFSPGTMAKLGFAHDEVMAAHPRLIYCSISGFGQAGPNRNLPAYDLILQGMGGLMSITGPVGGPPTKVGVPIADLTAGMFAMTGIMTALYHRERTGRGQVVDTSLLDGQLALLTFQAGRYFATGEAPTWQGNEHPSIAPYETFKTADGYINVAVGNEALWAKFCPAVGLEDCLADPRFAKNADRLVNRPALIERIERAFAAHTSDQLLATLQAAGVPCGPIYNLERALTDPHVEAQGLVRSVEHPTAGTVRFAGPPYRLSEVERVVDKAPPRLGEHTAEILAELGLMPASAT